MELPDLSKERVAFVGDLKGSERIYRHLVNRYNGTTVHNVDSGVTLLVVGVIDPDFLPMHPRINAAYKCKVKMISESDFMLLLNPTI